MHKSLREMLAGARALPALAIWLIPAPVSAQASQTASIPTAAQQIALAVLPAPKSMRDAATVLGYTSGGKLVTLRKGSGGLVCLAANPVEKQFHVSCYHKSLEPFMARGREVRATLGDKRGVVDSVRAAEIKSGKIRMPARAVLYQVFAFRDSVDVATAKVKSPSYLNVVYIPYATPENTGLSTEALKGTPWLMFPGKPWAHIMIME